MRTTGAFGFARYTKPRFGGTARKRNTGRGLLGINTNLGWHEYYVKRFNKSQHPDAEHLALYYLMLALRDADEILFEAGLTVRFSTSALRIEES